MITITGSRGYIGSLLARYLKPHPLKLYDSKNSSSEDLMNLHTRQEAAIGSDVIVHLAATSGIKACEDDRAFAWENNHAVSVHLAKFAKKSGCKKFIFASSSAVYGETHSYLIDECCMSAPRTVYGETKLRAEVDLMALNDPDFKVFILRKSNVFGFGMFWKGITVIDKFIEAFIDNRPITIAGTGVQKRDFVHIIDVVRLYAKLATDDNVRAGIYNVGGDEIISIRELAYLVNKIGEWVFGFRVPIKFKDSDSSSGWHDFDYDCSKIKMECQFKPHFNITTYITERMMIAMRYDV